MEMELPYQKFMQTRTYLGKAIDRVEVEQGVRQLSCSLFFIANVCESDTNMLHNQDEPVVC